MIYCKKTVTDEFKPFVNEISVKNSTIQGMTFPIFGTCPKIQYFVYTLNFHLPNVLKSTKLLRIST